MTKKKTKGKKAKKRGSYKIALFHVELLGITTSSSEVHFKVRFGFYTIIRLFKRVFKSSLNDAYTRKLYDTFLKFTKLKEIENY